MSSEAESQSLQDNNVVGQPIINDPYSEPTRYWYIPTPTARRRGEPNELREGRRPAGYLMRQPTRKRKGQVQLALMEEEFVPLALPNALRDKVRAWREAGYPGATWVTRDLLAYWQREGRERRLFFCQIEAAETVILLTEAPANYRQGVQVPEDEPTAAAAERRQRALRRYACKMATGSGKTVVMAMLAAWSVTNKAANPRDTRFSDAVLAVCPNLTIRERLQVLKPSNPENYYDAFDLVPARLREMLNRGRFMVTNWHVFQPEDDTGKARVQKRGREGGTAFCNRVLRELGGKRNILVINDEAHHAYRPADLSEEERRKLRRDDKADLEEATIWVGGLDMANAVRGVNMCLDFSATPFYLGRLGHREGDPFPWVTSDFSLVDAIESGLVAIPQIPLRDDQGRPTPKFKRLWDAIMDDLPAHERGTGLRGPKPEAIYREASSALANIASEWKATFDDWQRRGEPIPPVLIIVCPNTEVAAAFHDGVARGDFFADLANRDGREVTVRIDTGLLDSLKGGETGSAGKEAERLREIVATVGQEGKPGGQVRCVVSVGMLSEGWDAHNVTHILGVRSFTSQLLCEQVVGRGLRRTQYDDLTVPEYVKVYGVPFDVIPVQEAPVKGGKRDERSAALVYALPERAKAFEITFPRVEGYIEDTLWRVRCDVESLPVLKVGPQREPIRVTVSDGAGLTAAVDDRDEAWQEWSVQGMVFGLARDLTELYAHPTGDAGAEGEESVAAAQKRAVLFPQVLGIIRRYMADKVRKPKEVRLEELNLLSYRDKLLEILREAIRPDVDGRLLPVISPYRPKGSSRDVRFRTGRLVEPSVKSHLNCSVLDNIQWERMAIACFEQHSAVISYVRNDHLDFEIPYHLHGVRRSFYPDFIVRGRVASGEVSIVVEIKGYQRDADDLKQVAATKWIEAVNNHGGYGRWAFVWCSDPDQLRGQLDAVLKPTA